MIPELGNFALILSLCLAVVLATVPMIGSLNNTPGWVALARPAALGQFTFLLISFACLVNAFLSNDFSVLYVAQNGNSQLPIIYKISAVWGAHEGSLLLWALILGTWTVAVSLFSRKLPAEVLARVLSVMGMVSIGFISFMLFTSNPFDRIFPAPLEGGDLNPLLQDFGLAVHPPMLYMGYVGLSVAFSFAIAALIGGKLDAAWARWSRPWTLIAWVFLTIGITLGSWWAYYELGWGGWWFWDAVENASFMPWLIGTALIHSLAVTEKRGLFKSWTLLLAITAFSLSLLGTFLVRSGIIVSVHAFATDPTRGFFILSFLAIVVIGALVLYAWRAPSLDSDAGFGLLSRETFLLLNNVLLVVATTLVLIGTLSPLVIEMATGSKISIGPPWFNVAFLVPMIPLVILLGMGMHTAWRTQNAGAWARRLRIPAIIAILLGVVIPLLVYGRISILLVVGCAAAVWIVVSSLILPVRSLFREKGTAGITRSALGMCVAHLGMGSFVLGATVVSAFGVESDQALKPGDSIDAAGYEFHMVWLSNVQGPNFSAIEAEIEIREGGEHVATVRPQKRQYLVQKSPMTEAGIRAGLDKDLFVALGDQLGNNTWSVRVQYKPLIRFIWLGALIMALGGLIAISDRRYRVRVRKKAVIDTGEAEATA